MKKTEALVIGKGPAGIQAAVYCQRGNIETTVIGKDYGASETAREIDNYYGFTSIGGVDLIERGIDQAKQLGIDVVTDEVVGITFEGDGYRVTTVKEEYTARSVLIATGAQRSIPRVRKIRNFHGKGVSYCAVCDAFFYRGKTVAVIGSGDYAAHEASELVEVAETVYVLTNGEEPTGQFDSRCKIVTDRLKMVVGEERVTGIETESTVISLSGIFVALGSASSTDLAYKLGCATESGRIVVDENMQTNLPGLYAAGDCVFGVQQIAKAVGDGCIAGMNMVSYIRALKRG